MYIEWRRRKNVVKETVMKTLLINKYYCRQEGRGTNPVGSMQKGDETP